MPPANVIPLGFCPGDAIESNTAPVAEFILLILPPPPVIRLMETQTFPVASNVIPRTVPPTAGTVIDASEANYAPVVSILWIFRSVPDVLIQKFVPSNANPCAPLEERMAVVDHDLTSVVSVARIL